MDTISEVLKVVRVTGAAFFNAEFTEPWGFSSPPTASLAETLGVEGTERLAVYHLVTEGSANIGLEGRPGLMLEAGDIVIFPHGDRHVMQSGRPTILQDMAQKLPKLLADPMRVMRLGGNGPVTKFICGYFGFDREAGRLFLTGLPKLVKIGMRGDARLSWLETTIGYAIKEVQNHRPGSLALLSKTSEALFIEALSRYMDTMSPDARGWLAAVRDPIVGVALGELHKEPAYPWNVGELARRAGASRTMLSKRFHHLLGQTPMNYLATWRLQLGAQYLKTSRRTVIQVAADVGYESEAAFNRAFKREFGKPPANYRRSHAQRGQSVANP